MQEEIVTVCDRAWRSSGSVRPVVSSKLIANQNWNEAWEKTIRPIHATKRIVIRPTWHTYAPGQDEIVIIIDPKMSFGTGYHETTRLVLRLMENRIGKGSRVLDVGTGTGILAITAVKLGAATSVGTDIDEWSYENAKENLTLNGVAESVVIVQAELSSLPLEPFDLILANIQRNILLALLPAMVSRLAPAGGVILSGLLTGDHEEMRDALSRHSMNIREELGENEWIAMYATRSR
jgi:ribosomal protein L11 methyltransferase